MLTSNISFLTLADLGKFTPCVITYTKFGDERLRGLVVAGGQILSFPIDFDRRPYNSLALAANSYYTRDQTVVNMRTRHSDTFCTVQTRTSGR